jgi:KaiC/GvpD/RAD55 family RecA-like ATPase
MDNRTLQEVYRYSELVSGGVQNRNSIVDFINLYPKLFQEGLNQPDVYCGMFQFDSALRDFMETSKSIAGFKGKHFAHLFTIDIDAPHGDVDEARKLAITITQYLASLGVSSEEYYIYFSGAKGFHISLPHVLFGLAPANNLNDTLKQMAVVISKLSGVALSTKDAAGIDLIYDMTRLLRAPNTLHSKTGLYKTQLSLEELETFEIDTIFTVSESIRGPLYSAKPKGENDRLRDLYMQAQLASASRKAQVMPRVTVDGNPSLTHLKNSKVCIAKLMQGVGSGSRDNVAIRLADHFRKQGMPREIAEASLYSWNQKNNPPLSDEDISIKINSAWNNQMDFGCYDHILAANCSSTCYLYKNLVQNKGKTEQPEAKEKNLKTREDLVKAYVDRFFEEPGISLGIPALDPHIKLHGGHVLEYMAKSGSGKTSFAMHLMNNLSKKQIPSLFLSLEMSDADVAERSFQMATNSTSVALEFMLSKFAQKNMPREEMTEAIIEKMGSAFSSVITVDEDSSSIEAIEEYIFKAKETFGVKVIFIDYLGRVSQTKATSYEHVSALAKELKTMAKRHDVVVIYLHQVNRSIEDASSAVEMSSGRDSGQTEEAADVVLGSWRPGLADGLDEFVIEILKNRRGSSNIRAFMQFEPATMQFNEIKDGYESKI